MNISRARLNLPAVTRFGADYGPAVLHVVGAYLPPSEHWVYDQVRNIAGYRSVFASKRLTHPEAFAWDPIYSTALLKRHEQVVERISRRLVGRSPFLESVCNLERPALVHAHGGLTTPMARFAARRLSLPLVTSFYGMDMWKHKERDAGLRRRYRALFKEGTLFLVEGPAAAAQLERIGAPSERIRIHRLGVAAGTLQFSPRPERLRGLNVLMAARFTAKKGLPAGVEAFCRAASQRPDMRLTIVGGGTSRESRRIHAALRETIARYDCTDRVLFHPFMPRTALLELSREHDVLLHPSEQAPNGNAEGGHPVIMTLLGATGMPVIATYHCDIPQIVVNGVTGWLVEERDIGGLTRALLEAVDNRSILQARGVAAHKHVNRDYDLASNSLDTVYDEVLRLRVSKDSHASSIRS